MIDIIHLFLEKSELPHRKKSMLVAPPGIPPILVSQNYLFQWKYSHIDFFTPGELRVVKKILHPKTETKVALLHF